MYGGWKNECMVHAAALPLPYITVCISDMEVDFQEEYVDSSVITTTDDEC